MGGFYYGPREPSNLAAFYFHAQPGLRPAGRESPLSLGTWPANLRPDERPAILNCHCTYAQVVPTEVKEAVLRKLCESGGSFEAVADLCEMSARGQEALPQRERAAAPGRHRGVEHAQAVRRGSADGVVRSGIETQFADRQGNQTVSCRSPRGDRLI